MTTLILRELAKTLDVGPRDALDIAREHGVRIFWHEGARFTLDQLDRYLKRDHIDDPTPELEFDSTPSLEDYLKAG